MLLAYTISDHVGHIQRPSQTSRPPFPCNQNVVINYWRPQELCYRQTSCTVRWGHSISDQLDLPVWDGVLKRHTISPVSLFHLLNCVSDDVPQLPNGEPQ